MPFPTIAYINGSCMGGGTELSLFCDYRIASMSDKTKIALPEVNLGIFPGFGGTQNLPKIVGLINSLNMILTGKVISAKKALRIGLVDKIIHDVNSGNELILFAQKLQKQTSRIIIKSKRNKNKFIEKIPLVKTIILRKAKTNIIKKTRGFYPAPLAALNVIKNTIDKPLKIGLQFEATEFAKLANSRITNNLIDLYFCNEALKKENFTNLKAKKEIQNIAVLGAGIMGGGIAWLFSKINLNTRIKDINNKAIAIGYQQIHKIYGQLKKLRKYRQTEIDNKIAKISATTEYVAFGKSDLAIEAIIENLDIKKKTLKEFEQKLPDDCIIASNTSSIKIAKIATSLKKPERFLGIHFFNPVNRMPLVEIIPGPKTSKQTIADAVAIIKKTGKTPIVVGDCAGFLVNRILIPYINEAAYILEDTQEIFEIDEIIYNFGMPMGPFTLADTVGIDVGYKVAEILENEYGERMKIAPLLSKMYNKEKLLGKKANAGFFKYLPKNKKIVNEKVTKYFNKAPISLAKQKILERCIFIMINEAAKCLEEKIIDNPKYLDMAMIMGTGFPAFRGGLLKYADNYGINEIVTRLKEFEKSYGCRFSPANLLLKMAKENKSFY
jgi:3-hydroxyacyl-CoA dehydrogenase / enoyl-CoA hydratase / 3-hydroxybutyryl-CoA epimerase